MLELLVALPFLLAAVVALLGTQQRSLVAWLSALAPLGGLAILAMLTPAVIGGEIPAVSHAWIPQIGLDFSVRLDGLAWMFAGLVLGIGLLIVIYARYYLAEADSAPRFFAYLLLFMGAMLGMVVAGNLLLLAVFWELTSISSFLLIGYWFHRADAREGAQMALVITGMGGLALLGGAVLIGQIVGSYELEVVLASGDLIRAHPLYPAACVLVLVGVFTKSAQFPFHFWLPHAMAAPTPVSAYLHSATMVKAGVFLLARMHPALADTDLWFFLVSGVGAITMLLGAWKAIFQHDLKGLLAYSTISHLGLITLLFGLSTPLAVVAGLFHILNHATFKASLFMAAGIIDHECKTRDIRKLHRLAKLMPMTSALAIIAALAMAGIPLLNGFLSKEMFFALALEIEQHDTMRILISVAALLAGLFGVAYSLRFVHDVFFAGDAKDMKIIPHEPPRWMRIPVEVLVVLCVLVGLMPALTIAPVLKTAAVGVLGERLPEYSLAIWHGINAPLLMSIGGTVGGVVLYLLLRRYTDLHGDVRRSLGRSVFLWLRARVDDLAGWLTATVENGRLQHYLLYLVLAAMLMAGVPWLQFDLATGSLATQPLTPIGFGLTLMTLIACAAVLRWRRQRLIALIVIGAVGLLVSLIFALLSAPDLALTQLLVEMVTVALMLLALNFLPAETPHEEPLARRGRDALIALAAGGGVMALVYAVLTRPLETVASDMLARSLGEGGGTNVVNVILVDFRGYDTMGEIAVFGLAGVIVHALLVEARLRAAPAATSAEPVAHDDLLIPTLVGRLLFPLALSVAIFMYLRGHNLPGGGFIAGLVLAVPLLLQYVLSGADATQRRLRVNYQLTIGLGLIIATLTGVASFVFGYPFLTSTFGYPAVPVIGELPLASAMAFDLGVFLVVAGSGMLTLAMLGTVATRSERSAS